MTVARHKTVFSDQDLEDLRDAVGTEITASAGDDGAWYTLFDSEKVDALVRRLVLAEGVCSELMQPHGKVDVELALRNWRMARADDGGE